MENANLTISGKMNMSMLEESKKMYGYLKMMSEKPMKYNTALLLQILEKNKDTEYGKKYGFKDIKTIEEFQKIVPVSVFDDYAGYIYEMTEHSAKNLNTASKIPHYAKSSGTMGNPKRIPESEESLLTLKKYNHLLRIAMMNQKLGMDWMNGKAINLIEAGTGVLPCGATYGAISGRIVQEMGEHISEICTSPIEALLPDEQTNTRYLHARFALQDADVTWGTSSFISIFLMMMQYIEKEWEILVNDIENGTINEDIKMPPEVRASVLKKLVPMPERAKELREIFEDGFDIPIIPRLWPKLQCIVAVCTGGFSNYLYKMKERYIDDSVHILYVGLTASEGLFSVPFELDNPEAVLVPDSVFYEFLPIDSENFDDMVTMDKLEVGKTYEIIFTNFSGFYRYRMRDAVKVTGYHNQLPIVEFQYRIDHIIHLTGEKTTEKALRFAAESTEKELGYQMEEFSAYGDEDAVPLRYNYLMEIHDVPEGLKVNQIVETLEKYLRQGNPLYAMKRDKEILDQLNLRFLQPETYLLYREFKIMKGASSAQVKPPRILMNERDKRFFNALIDEEMNKKLEDN